MNEIKTAFAAMLYLLAKLSKFNAFAGGFVGFCYGMLASVLDREFLGLGSTQITLLGVACFVVFFRPEYWLNDCKQPSCVRR